MTNGRAAQTRQISASHITALALGRYAQRPVPGVSEERTWPTFPGLDGPVEVDKWGVPKAAGFQVCPCTVRRLPVDARMRMRAA